TVGFSNIRVGDRVEVRGIGRANGAVAADYVALLGRPIPADPTGVGQTRSPSSSASTPTVGGTTPPPAPDRLAPAAGADVQVTAGTGRQVGALTSRGVSVDRRNDVIRLDTGRGQVRVDLTSATDTSGRGVRGSDLQVGDRVDLSGNYSGDSFIATTVRFTD